MVERMNLSHWSVASLENHDLRSFVHFSLARDTAQSDTLLGAWWSSGAACRQLPGSGRIERRRRRKRRARN